jgi:predicted TIM-barrel fold metal-dependent hydrolase
VLAESGIGWLPYFLTRMDLEWRNLRDKIDYATRTPPSELFRRQVLATFEEEALAAQLLPLLGADSCMWASDYPHTDSTFPNSLRAIGETLGALPAADRRKITAMNCARLYGFAHASCTDRDIR